MMDLSPSFVTLDPCRVVGMTWSGHCENNEIPGLWDRFIPRENEVVIEGDCLGICRNTEEVQWPHFEYMAGFVSSMTPPEGMEAWDLPGGKYVQFTIAGLAEIRPTVQAFYQEWLPASGLTGREAPSLELYPLTFPQEPHLHLLFPIE